MIHFGDTFEKNQLPEVKAFSPPIDSDQGYDGQFYAQLALHPLLRGEAIIQALDYPLYRARRIGLPWLAFLLGAGRPTWILQIYPLLNFAFWVMLLFILSRQFNFKNTRGLLTAIGILCSSGTLTSMARAVLDLPAAAIGVCALYYNGPWFLTALLLGFSSLIKETSLLSAAVGIPYQRMDKIDLKKGTAAVLIMLVPTLLWILYIHLKIKTASPAWMGNFSFPMVGIIRKFIHNVHNIQENIHLIRRTSFYRTYYLFEFLAPLSLIVQAVYLLIHPRLDSRPWQFGIGFAALLAIIGDSVWVEQYAYTRVVLPLTFSFNLLLHEHENRKEYAMWFTAGNLGLSWVALRFLLPWL